MTEIHVYDRADWYVPGANIPADMQPYNAMTPTGFFIQWALENGLVSDRFRQETAEVISAVLFRKLTPIHLYAAWQGVFDSTMLSDRGNAFAQKYFDHDGGFYLIDYAETFIEYDHHYRPEPTWENYELVAPLISMRYDEWGRFFDN